MKLYPFLFWFLPIILGSLMLIHADYMKEINKLNARINELENQVLVMKLEMEK